MSEIRKIRAGFVGFGEVNTPKEFIVNRCADAAKMLKKEGLELFITEPVCDDSEGKEAARARTELAKNDVDPLTICVYWWRPY